MVASMVASMAVVFITTDLASPRDLHSDLGSPRRMAITAIAPTIRIMRMGMDMTAAISYGGAC